MNMGESGIEVDIGSFLADDDFPEFEGSFGELKSNSFVDKTVKTEVKHVSTPLNVNLRMQLQKQQLEDQQKRNSFQHQQRSVAQSTAINMPITVQALKSDIPANIVQVKTGLANPTKYHLQQSRNHQIHSFLSQSVKSSNRFPHSMPSQHHAAGSQQLTESPQYTTLQTRGHGSSSSMPDPTSPLSVLSSSAHSGGSPSEDDILDNILKLEQVDPATNDQDLNLLIDQLSSTVPHDFDSGSLAEHSQQLAHKQTSASAPPTDDLSAWVKDRVKKDNHNQIERRRRYNINDRIKELGTLLPSTSDPDFRQNKGTILKASVDYIRDLKQDQVRLRSMEDKMKEQERHNRMIMLRLQQCEMMLKSTGLVSNDTSLMPNSTPSTVKLEPAHGAEAMDEDTHSPLMAGPDPMLSSSLTSPQTLSMEDALSQY